MNFSVLVWVMFACITAAVIVLLIAKIAEWAQNNRAPQETVRATLIRAEKHTDTSLMPMGTDGAMMPIEDVTYSLLFQTERGETKKFSVAKRVYRAVSQGQTGTLRFQGTRFLDFTPD